MPAFWRGRKPLTRAQPCMRRPEQCMHYTQRGVGRRGAEHCQICTKIKSPAQRRGDVDARRCDSGAEKKGANREGRPVRAFQDTPSSGIAGLYPFHVEPACGARCTGAKSNVTIAFHSQPVVFSQSMLPCVDQLIAAGRFSLRRPCTSGRRYSALIFSFPTVVVDWSLVVSSYLVAPTHLARLRKHQNRANQA